MSELPSLSTTHERPLCALPNEPEALYITLGPNQSVKMGTCEHCVVAERERPARAWDAIDDSDLDFDRDLLLRLLAELGVQIVERRAYVCP